MERTVYQIEARESCQLTTAASVFSKIGIDNEAGINDLIEDYVREDCNEYDRGIFGVFDDEKSARAAFDQMDAGVITRRNYDYHRYGNLITLYIDIYDLTRVTLETDENGDEEETDCETIDRKHTVYKAN